MSRRTSCKVQFPQTFLKDTDSPAVDSYLYLIRLPPDVISTSSSLIISLSCGSGCQFSPLQPPSSSLRTDSTEIILVMVTDLQQESGRNTELTVLATWRLEPAAGSSFTPTISFSFLQVCPFPLRGCLLGGWVSSGRERGRSEWSSAGDKKVRMNSK